MLDPRREQGGEVVRRRSRARTPAGSAGRGSAATVRPYFRASYQRAPWSHGSSPSRPHARRSRRRAWPPGRARGSSQDQLDAVEHASRAHRDGRPARRADPARPDWSGVTKDATAPALAARSTATQPSRWTCPWNGLSRRTFPQIGICHSTGAGSAGRCAAGLGDGPVVGVAVVRPGHQQRRATFAPRPNSSVREGRGRQAPIGQPERTTGGSMPSARTAAARSACRRRRRSSGGSARNGRATPRRRCRRRP